MLTFLIEVKNEVRTLIKALIRHSCIYDDKIHLHKFNKMLQANAQYCKVLCPQAYLVSVFIVYYLSFI